MGRIIAVCLQNVSSHAGLGIEGLIQKKESEEGITSYWYNNLLLNCARQVTYQVIHFVLTTPCEIGITLISLEETESL